MEVDIWKQILFIFSSNYVYIVGAFEYVFLGCTTGEAVVDFEI